MSLVGTRPPTVDEYEQYELGHRKRLQAAIAANESNIHNSKISSMEMFYCLHLNIRQYM